MLSKKHNDYNEEENYGDDEPFYTLELCCKEIVKGLTPQQMAGQGHLSFSLLSFSLPELVIAIIVIIFITIVIAKISFVIATIIIMVID